MVAKNGRENMEPKMVGRGRTAKNVYSVNKWHCSINCKRFAQSARPGPEKACLLELFFAILDVFGIIFKSIFDHRKLGALGPTFNVRKWIGPPKVPDEAPHPEKVFSDFFGLCF